MKLRNTVAGLAVALTVGVGTMAGAQAEEVNVYSYRQPFLIKPLLDAFTEKTGIETNVLFDDKALIERMVQEGQNSPADLLLTVDIGRLENAVASGVTQSAESEVLEKNIPAAYRDENGQWFGLTTRARVIFASRDRVEQDTITYEELADPKWKGKICMRSGQHVYNVALIASIIAHDGEEKAEEWLRGVKANLARKPAGNDRAQVKGIYTGECDIALANTYYMAKMLQNDKEPEQKEWARSARIIFPNTDDRGTHVNVSGVALAKNAPNRENAIKLMEFLSSDGAQQIYAEVNNEYPVNPDVEASELVESWGDFKRDPLPLDRIAELRKKASELVDKVGFDDGPES